ncbi:MAG: YafY family protein [Pseudomonadota bacterium]
MARSDRLFDLLTRLRTGGLHTAHELAAALGVSDRTLYRDIATLKASGVPVAGTPGAGYRITDAIALPPLTLTPEELEALNLGMAIVAEAADDGLRAAAASLAAKVDAVLPEETIAEADTWKFETYPFADAARGAGHMGRVRAAIRARQKLRLTYHSKGDRITTRTVRPLHMEYWGRVWTLTAWCELREDFRAFRLDLIQSAEPLPDLFVDERGKTYADYIERRRGAQ